MSQLSINGLSKSYGSFKVFEGLDLSADAGEIVVIFGGSGTGKTILLRLIAGVGEPSAGSIAIGGHDVSDIAPEHRGIGIRPHALHVGEGPIKGKVMSCQWLGDQTHVAASDLHLFDAASGAAIAHGGSLA